MTVKLMNIGMIGLDTSHVVSFCKILNDPQSPYHIPNARVTCAYPGGSADFPLSISRVEGFTNQLKDEFGILIVDSPEAVAEKSDAILLESVDGRVHLEQFRKIAPYRKPVFIDKPFAVETADAVEIVKLADAHGIPLLTSSALRYAEGLKEAVADTHKGGIIGADTYGPMDIEPTQKGYFWYGIHSVEMLFTILGSGCKRVSAAASEDHELITGYWQDGRIGTVRGNRKGNNTFGALIHRDKGSDFVDVYANPKPYYASMLEQIITMFQTGQPPIEISESLQIIRFIEAANESRVTGAVVSL